MQWQQASFPIKVGGLGKIKIKSIASLAFLASVSKRKQLQNCFLSRCSNVFPDHHFDLYLDDWCKNNQPIQPPAGSLLTKQKSLDKPVIDKICSTLHASQPDDHNRARLLAASAVLRLVFDRLDGEGVRVPVGLRLGTNLRDQHRCHCGTVVD